MDGSWTRVAYDISAIADGQPSVQVRWGLGPTDGGLVLCGWNIDDVAFTSTTGGGEETLPEYHSADVDTNHVISMSELLRVIQLYNVGAYHCDGSGEDGFVPGKGATGCATHSSDYAPADWHIGLSELLRAVQLFNSAGYEACANGEDGFCPLAR
jgi:hypothetical protein